MVKIVKPKDCTMNMYTYYMRDAQGNIMATYTRNFSKVLDFSAITYTAANDTIKKFVGVSGLGNFAASIGANTGLINNYYGNLQNNQTFLKTFNPYTLLLNKAGALDTVLNRMSNEDRFRYYFGFNNKVDQLCMCLNERATNNTNYHGTLFTLMSTQAGFEFLLTKISEQGGPAGIQNIANNLSLDGSEYEKAVMDLSHYVFDGGLNSANLENVISALYVEYPELNSCDGMLRKILEDLYVMDENTFVAMMLEIPDILEIFNPSVDTQIPPCTLTLTKEQLASDLSMNRTSQTWAALLAWTTESDLINYYKTDEPVTFLSTAIKFQYTLLAPYQQTHNLYGGNYGGLENYFVSMRSYFGQTLYDQLTEGFLKQSSTYKDSMNLTEWHIYGSSRLGIYQTKVNMAYRSVKVENGVTTQVSTTSISYASYSYFPTERGAKRYELTNHLGNVLVVVSDKKIPICSSNVVTFYKADVVSATDYSAFGAPLAERSWQASEYRFGFNGKEADNEINGTGNDYDFGARIYDARLGRWLTRDPSENKYPGINAYNFALNMPIMINDPDGKDFRVTIAKGNNGVNVVTIESTVHLYGPDAEELFKQIKGFTANGMVKIDGQEYQIKITVAYTVNLKLNDAIPAEVHERMETNLEGRKYKSMGVERGDNIAFINSKLSIPANGVTSPGEDDTKIRNVSPYTLIHESLHMLGLDERYTFSRVDKNFTFDYMSNSAVRNKFNKIHYYDFAKFVKENIPENASCLPVPLPKIDYTGGVSELTHKEMDDKTFIDNSSKVSKDKFYLIK